MLTTLLLSFGIPMLLGGDEMGRTQQGNNNAYCQDNEITWFDWSRPHWPAGFHQAADRVAPGAPGVAPQPVPGRSRGIRTALVYPGGHRNDRRRLVRPNALAIALYLDGSDDPDRAADGTWLLDDDFLVLVNAWWEPLEFVLPATRPEAGWRVEIDTFDPASPAGSAAARYAGDCVTAGPCSVVVLLSPR